MQGKAISASTHDNSFNSPLMRFSNPMIFKFTDPQIQRSPHSINKQMEQRQAFQSKTIFLTGLEFRSHEAEIEHKAFKDDNHSSSDGVTFGAKSHFS